VGATECGGLGSARRMVHLSPTDHGMTRARAILLVLAAALLSGGGGVLTFAWLGRLGPLTFNWQGQNYELLHPEYLAIVWVAPLLLLGLRFSLADLPWQQRWLSWLLRVALVGTL